MAVGKGIYEKFCFASLVQSYAANWHLIIIEKSNKNQKKM